MPESPLKTIIRRSRLPPTPLFETPQKLQHVDAYSHGVAGGGDNMLREAQKLIDAAAAESRALYRYMQLFHALSDWKGVLSVGRRHRWGCGVLYRYQQYHLLQGRVRVFRRWAAMAAYNRCLRCAGSKLATRSEKAVLEPAWREWRVCADQTQRLRFRRIVALRWERKRRISQTLHGWNACIQGHMGILDRRKVLFGAAERLIGRSELRTFRVTLKTWRHSVRVQLRNRGIVSKRRTVRDARTRARAWEAWLEFLYELSWYAIDHKLRFAQTLIDESVDLRHSLDREYNLSTVSTKKHQTRDFLSSSGVSWGGVSGPGAARGGEGGAKSVETFQKSSVRTQPHARRDGTPPLTPEQPRGGRTGWTSGLDLSRSSVGSPTEPTPIRGGQRALSAGVLSTPRRGAGPEGMSAGIPDLDAGLPDLDASSSNWSIESSPQSLRDRDESLQSTGTPAMHHANTQLSSRAHGGLVPFSLNSPRTGGQTRDARGRVLAEDEL